VQKLQEVVGRLEQKIAVQIEFLNGKPDLQARFF